MPWAKLDDQFPIHRKVGALSDASFRLHVEAICWCVRNLTDGAVSREDLPQVTRIKKAERYAAELVRRGAWSETADGWEIHDFLDYQPSKTQVQRERADNAERQRRWRERHSVSNGVTGAVTNAAPTRPDPSPSSGNPSGSTSRVVGGAGGKPRERGTRIPDNFAVSDALAEWAHEHAPGVDIQRETTKFVNYWRAKAGKDATKLDWRATWRNWMLRAAEYAPNPRASPNGTQPGVTATERKVATALEAGRTAQAFLDQQQRLEITP